MATTNMLLQKAQFHSLEKSKTDPNKETEVTVLVVNFNPKELTLQRSASFGQAENKANAAELQYKGGDNLTLGMTLYFDTFEAGASVRTVYMTKLEKLMKVKDPTPPATTGTPAPNTAASSGGTGKTDKTKDDKAQGTASPPSVLFVWGKFRFKGVITSLSQKYTMFLADGTPVRAEATISMQQTAPTTAELAAEDDDALSSDKPSAEDTKAYGALAFQNPNAGDDPFQTLLNGGGGGTPASAAKALLGGTGATGATATAAAAAAQKTGLGGFMDEHGKSMVEAGLAGYITGGKKGAFEGVLTSAGNTNAFGTGTVGTSLNTLASGKELNLASISGGFSDTGVGSVGGGINIGLKRDGTKFSLGASEGGAVSTSSGKSIYGVSANQTVSSDGGYAHNSTQGIGVGSSGTSGTSGSGGSATILDTSKPSSSAPATSGSAGSPGSGSGGTGSGSGDGSGTTGTGGGSKPGGGSGSGSTDGSGSGGSGAAGGGSTGSGGKPIPVTGTPGSTGGGSGSTGGSGSGSMGSSGSTGNTGGSGSTGSGGSTGSTGSTGGSGSTGGGSASSGSGSTGSGSGGSGSSAGTVGSGSGSKPDTTGAGAAGSGAAGPHPHDAGHAGGASSGSGSGSGAAGSGSGAHGKALEHEPVVSHGAHGPGAHGPGAHATTPSAPSAGHQPHASVIHPTATPAAPVAPHQAIHSTTPKKV